MMLRDFIDVDRQLGIQITFTLTWNPFPSQFLRNVSGTEVGFLFRALLQKTIMRCRSTTRCHRDLRIPLQTRTYGRMDEVPTTVIIGPSVRPSVCLPEAITRRARPDRTFREQSRSHHCEDWPLQTVICVHYQLLHCESSLLVCRRNRVTFDSVDRKFGSSCFNTDELLYCLWIYNII